MTKILILGGGFGAIAAAEEIARSIDETHEVTLASATRDFTFFPALVPFVFGDFQEEEIHFDLGPRLAERRIRFVQGKVRSIDARRQIVEIGGHSTLETLQFDYLLIAIGRRLETERIPGFFEHSHHLLGIKAAARFKRAISEFKSGSIVVGLCPDAFLPIPVCESALALADRFAVQIKENAVTVSAVFPSTLDDAFAGATLFRDVKGAFEKKGIRLVEDFPVDRLEDARIVAANGSAVAFDLLMLVPPFCGQTSVQKLGGLTDQAGFAKVNEQMQIKGFESVYAAGDIIALPGPKFGYMAIKQGKIAAQNIVSQINGLPAVAKYRHKLAWAIAEKYTDPIFFHYGFWDESLDDFDENAFFGMAKFIRQRYGQIKGFGKPLEETKAAP